MLKVKFSVLILILFFLFSFVANAGNYLDGALLRSEGDIKVYLINNNIKRWVSSIEVFNSNNFKWRDVKIVSKKEIGNIKNGEPIVLEKVSPTSLPETSITPIPNPSPKTMEEIAPIPAKINLQFPEIDYISANWLTSYTTSRYGRIGQRIVFKYSDKKADKIENFRLYEKKPGDKYFVRIATFEEVSSVGCDEDIDIDGEWMITEAGQCGYWSIQRVVTPGGRDAVAYLPAEKYLVGEYSYYVAGADKDGSETRPSPEAKLAFLNPVDILSPTDGQQLTGIYPVFKWSIADSWPDSPDYFISISDSDAAQNPVWTKQIKILEDKSDRSFTYNGSGLDPTKKYKVYIYGHYRKSEYDPDYISIPSVIPEFRIKTTSSVMSFLGLFKALFLSSFDFLP